MSLRLYSQPNLPFHHTSAKPRSPLDPLLAPPAPHAAPPGDLLPLLEGVFGPCGFMLRGRGLPQQAAQVDEVLLAGRPLGEVDAGPLGDEGGGGHGGGQTSGFGRRDVAGGRLISAMISAPWHTIQAGPGETPPAKA